MYCVQCGAKLKDTEKKCPLCGTVAFHPDITREYAAPTYPRETYPVEPVSPKGGLAIITTLFLIPFLITLSMDVHDHLRVTWSGYVMGALLLTYVTAVLPWWFRRPNPVIFVPCDFLTLGLYLLYIDLYTEGHWFLSFAFPITGFVGVLVTLMVTLMRYLRGGRFYIYGGALMALGGFMMLLEFLLHITFSLPMTWWSVYPLIALVLLGGLLIFLAVNRRYREAVKKKIFI